ncbi:pur operon repressor [Zhaonella formicivorans]|jgi:purine operon repressor|uniref:pur operon repressor n=1 Tax=Zhaonella formicivorans TaxID=2528593 RepID=UPI0010DB9FC3|nr:pur operon repressor [Zhaonella formicivorans]
MRRSERIAIITKILSTNPRTHFSLNYFAGLLDAAKSTISEDLTLVRDTFQEYGLGQVVTIPGAAGGVKFLPLLSLSKIASLLEEMSERLAEQERIIPGGYLYMTDLIFNPKHAGEIGEIFATVFKEIEPDYVVTIETKGIPLAMSTARAFNVPLVIIRDDSKVTEGSAVSINYVSGSTRRIRTMALARRSMATGSKVLLIDDFMKAGGTARGMLELMAEFKAEVLGMGVLVSTTEPKEKLVDNYLALLELEALDEKEKRISIKPGKWLYNFTG